MDNTFHRDPSDYCLTIHAKQQRRDRNMELSDIETAIVNGTVKEVTSPEDADDEDDIGIKLRNKFLNIYHDVVIIPPKWNRDGDYGKVKTCWKPDE